MNELLLYVLVTVDINLSDFISNWTQYAFNPYTSLFGNLTWGFIFGFIGAGIYMGSKSQATTFTYLVIVGIIFAVILPQAMIGILGIIITFMGTVALYIAFVTTRHS